MSSHLGPAATGFVDGELDHSQRDEVLAHLTHCASCRSEVSALRLLKSSLRGTQGPAMPSDLSHRLLAASGLPAVSVPRPSRRPRGHRRLRRTAAGGAFLVIGVGGALSLAGPPPSAPAAKVDPASQRFVMDHATTAGEVPFSGPELVSVATVIR